MPKPGRTWKRRKEPIRTAMRIPCQTEVVMRLLIALALGLSLSACSGRPGLDDPALSDRALNLEEFFDGRLVAHGQFQDLFGTVSRRFEVDITGDWDGNRLRLVEDFVYEDGSTEQRIWTLRKTGPDTWEGTAPGVLGLATGQEQGDTFNWQYRIDLPMPDGDPIRVRFDDWMWLLTEDRLLNKAYMFRWGARVGVVTIFFEKL
jgi:hypothetical protein